MESTGGLKTARDLITKSNSFVGLMRASSYICVYPCLSSLRVSAAAIKLVTLTSDNLAAMTTFLLSIYVPFIWPNTVRYWNLIFSYRLTAARNPPSSILFTDHWISLWCFLLLYLSISLPPPCLPFTQSADISKLVCLMNLDSRVFCWWEMLVLVREKRCCACAVYFYMHKQSKHTSMVQDNRLWGATARNSPQLAELPSPTRHHLAPLLAHLGCPCCGARVQDNTRFPLISQNKHWYSI